MKISVFNCGILPAKDGGGSRVKSMAHRIGSTRDVPGKTCIVGKCLLLSVAVLLASLAACSSKVVYAPQNPVALSPSAININSATADELEKLPLIGRKTAENIVLFRTEHGPFRRIEHLLQIRGISETRFLELQPFLRTE